MVLVALLAGCLGAGTGTTDSQNEGRGKEGGKAERASVPAHVPAYDIAAKGSCPIGNQDAECIDIYSAATSREGIEAATRELWSENRDENALIVTIYPPRRPGADPSGAGFAFSDRGAARAVISSMYTASAGADIGGQVDKAMANDGIYVVPITGAVRSACAGLTAECTNY